MRAGAVAGIALLAAACGLDVPTLSLEARSVAEDTADSEPSVAFASTLSFLPAVALDRTTLTLADAVSRQSNLPTQLEQADCLTVETEANVVVYTFDGCTSPSGLSLSGVERATFTAVSAGVFDVTLESEGLSIGGRKATHEGVARIDVGGEEGRHVQFTGAFDGKTEKGRSVAITSDVELVLLDDGGAVRLDGEARIDIGLRGLDVRFDLARNGPLDTCPEGTILVTTRLTRLTLTLTLDGDDSATVDSARGGHGTIDLKCTPAGP